MTVSSEQTCARNIRNVRAQFSISQPFCSDAIILTRVALDFANSMLSDEPPLRFVLLLFAVCHDSPRCKFQRDLSIGVVWRSIPRCVRQACNSPTTKNHRAGKNVAAESSSETGERREENNGNSRSISRTLLGRRENRSRSDKAVYLRRNNRLSTRLNITSILKCSCEPDDFAFAYIIRTLNRFNSSFFFFCLD